MGKEQISIRLEPEILQKIDELAATEKRTRNNMLEVLILEALEARKPPKYKAAPGWFRPHCGLLPWLSHRVNRLR
jgi:hypothetical protein